MNKNSFREEGLIMMIICFLKLDDSCNTDIGEWINAFLILIHY